MFKSIGRTAAVILFALATSAAAQQPAAQEAPAAQPVFLQKPAQAQPSTQTPQPKQSTPSAAPNPDAGHEYAPLLEQELDYKDWTFKSLKDGAPVNLREFTRGKKLVMVVYFAPWCGNWRKQAPVVAGFYDKYKGQGFDVVAVSEYAAADDARKYFESTGGAPYTVVVESEAREDREKTTHYAVRRTCGDSRKWGTPFNVFLEPAKLSGSGDVLTRKAWVVGGEVIEKDAERFIREKLGLSENAGVEPCEIKKQ